MLRFSRVEDEVQLHLVKKGRRLSPSLLKGFALAIAFHALFLTLFQVVSPKAPDDLSLLLPSTVEIDLGQKLITHADPPSCPFETKRPPSLYELAPTAICSIESYSEFGCTPPDFSAIERLEYRALEVSFDHD